MFNMKLTALILTLGFLTSCKESAKVVLLVGDSWASFVCAHKSLNQALHKAGILDAEANQECATTTKLGGEAQNWLDEKFHQAARLRLKDKSVKAVYLSLGGNDFLSHWNRKMTLEEEQILFSQITDDTEAVLKVYRKQRPDLKILISAYDYPRFTENHPVENYRKTYENMGKPSPFELNSAILRFSERMSELADGKNVFYIQHYGLMHFYDGYEETNLAPQTTLSPDLISPPENINQSGGDPHLPSDPQSLLHLGGGEHAVVDAFHLSQAGYDRLAEHAVLHYLKSWLK
ncbi:MAG: SGNH/GDSL hydrolase family protein [Pseudobdellovibrionaceae bacterium]